MVNSAKKHVEDGQKKQEQQARITERTESDNRKKTREEIRVKRLRHFIDSRFNSNVSAMCKHYDLKESTRSQISQLLNGTAPFGSRVARGLEEKLHMPEGWMEFQIDLHSTATLLRYDVPSVAALPVKDRELIEAFIQLVIDKHGSFSKKPSEPLLDIDYETDTTGDHQQRHSA